MYICIATAATYDRPDTLPYLRQSVQRQPLREGWHLVSGFSKVLHCRLFNFTARLSTNAAASHICCACHVWGWGIIFCWNPCEMLAFSCWNPCGKFLPICMVFSFLRVLAQRPNQVCMYMCTYDYINICIYMYTEYIYMCTYVCTYIRVFVNTHIYV